MVRVGLDIGGTLIGMHLKKVAVPVRLAQNHIGDAILLAAAERAGVSSGAHGLDRRQAVVVGTDEAHDSEAYSAQCLWLSGQ